MFPAQQLVFSAVQFAIKELYNIETNTISIQKTRKEFVGDFTFVTFQLVKELKKSPEKIGEELGSFLLQHNSQIQNFNVIKGYLNVVLNKNYWIDYLYSQKENKTIGYKNQNSNSKTTMLEYSSPNTNKPLHLGHLRNILLGYSMSKILQANGNTVIKTNLINDRGIHICKSMLAWQKFGKGETPESTGIKGDHLVGKYYVEFDKVFKAQIKIIIDSGIEKEIAEKNAPILLECQQLLRLWEEGDKATIQLWETMNGWVYKGFDATYKNLGVDFDKIYYESNTYLLGKKIVDEGLQKNVFYRKENNSIAIDLTNEGLDEKIVMRSDGTSVYITQDIGTAIERFKEFPSINQLIYTVGNEQDYHFKVLFKILEKLNYDWAKECYHLSYGMVELPEGKMKSREGTVVDADELLQEMFDTAKQTTNELGKVENFSEEELNHLYRIISLGALKYFILKVDPKKKMLFDPKESIDFNGHTGPFIQYTHARIKSVLRKVNFSNTNFDKEINCEPIELEIIKLIYDFEEMVEEAAKTYSPAIVANYVYELCKLYNRFYHEISILKVEDENIKNFRLNLSQTTAQVIANAMNLLGIEVPERM